MPRAGAGRLRLRRAGAGLLVLLVAAAVTPPPSASAAPSSCSVVDFFAVTAGPQQRLNRYRVPGSLVASRPMPDASADFDAYADVATNADGSVVYAKGANSAVLYAVDPVTGAFSRQPLSGPVLPETTPALTSLPDGRLLAAGYRRIFVVDPVTGTSSEDPRALPAGQHFSGDLVVLPDGDLLALTQPDGRAQPFSDLVRISPAGTVTTLGTVRAGEALTTSGGAVYLPSEDGTVRRLDPVPTQPGTGPLPAVPLVGLGTQTVGAASTQDSGVCRPTFGASASQATTTYGQPPELIAFGLPRGASGTVSFSSGGRTLCSAPATSPTTRCAPGLLPAGRRQVTARWSATGAEATTSITVERAIGLFGAGLVSYNLVVGQAPVFRAYRHPVDATGRISYVAGGRLLCDVVLPAYTCTGPTDLAPGAYAVLATYPGDQNYTGFSAATSFRILQPLPTQVAVTRPPAVRTGRKVTLKISHLPSAAEGPVTFLVRGEEICTATLPHHSCRARVHLTPGQHRLTASYAGDGHYRGSTASTTLKVLRRTSS